MPVQLAASQAKFPLGFRRGRVEVVGYCHTDWTKKSRPGLVLHCDCGNTKKVTAANFDKFATVSCGCVQREGVSERMTTHGATKGGSRSPLYRVWRGMRNRCLDPRAQNYRWYGAKGITIDPGWDDFATFSKWAEASGYDPGLELDRVDVDGPYSPSNCRWVTKIQNLKGRRQYLPEEVDIALQDLAKKQGVSVYTLVRKAVEAFLIEEGVM